MLLKFILIILLIAKMFNTAFDRILWKLFLWEPMRLQEYSNVGYAKHALKLL
jgi:hypothetical protein